MADIISLQELADAKLDAQSLEQFINGGVDEEVLTRLSQQYPTIKKLLLEFQKYNGRAYKTYAEMDADKANIPAKSKVTVTNDSTESNNGDWQWDGVALTKSAYDPLTQAKEYANQNKLFNPVQITTGSLDSIETPGFYLTTAPSQATVASGYPYDGATGELEVKKVNGSTLVTHFYKTVTGRLFYRQKSTSFSAWVDLFAGLVKDNTVLLDKGALNSTTDLNTITQPGRYVQQANLDEATATLLNYPASIAGFLIVEKLATNAMIQQTYITITGEVYPRTFRTSWLSWGGAKKFDSYALLTQVMSTKTVLTASDDLDSLRTIGFYLKNVPTNTADTISKHHPTKGMGLLLVYKLPSSTMVVQELRGVDGSSYIRYYAGGVWTAWESSSAIFDDYLDFTKTATALNWYEKGRGGKNYLRSTLNKVVNPEINLDNWGINRLNESDFTLTDVRNITTNGVWECAIAAKDNISDHSGGTHGDEVLQSAAFIMDGIIYDQDAVVSGKAKEIVFIQKSTIYIEATQTPLCYRECKWIFRRGERRLIQTIRWAGIFELITAWIAMCPILRKANQDNTGEQITDKEMRSQDGLIINIAEPDFVRRDLQLKDGDSISLSGSASKFGIEVVINKIKAANPMAYVQNTIAYNKLYISGMTIDTNYTTAAGEIWEVDVSFKPNTAN